MSRDVWIFRFEFEGNQASGASVLLIAAQAAMSIKHLLELAAPKLGQVPSSRHEAEVLLCHALGVSRSFLYANADMNIPSLREHEFLELIRRRSRGEPVAYLVGHRAFWSLDLEVTPDVLIPRPETELLVEQALELIPREYPWRVADLGTGSGAIALAIASERPCSEVHATDRSSAALEVAQRNARLHGLESVRFHLGSWTEPLEGLFNLIASNPPYVAANDPHLGAGDCRFEPRLALVAAKGGMEALETVASEAFQVLNEGGYLLLEHGYDQAAMVRDVLAKSGYSGISTRRDLAGIERISWAQKPKQTGVLPVCW